MHSRSCAALTAAASLRRAERLFCTVPREDLTPAAQWLRDNARALYALAGLPGPKGRRYARLRGVCEELSRRACGPIRENALCRAAARAAGDEPLTVEELRALPDMLRVCLIGRLRTLLPVVLSEYRQWQAGGRPDAAPLTPVAVWRARMLAQEAGQAEDARRLEGRLRAAGIDPRDFARRAREALEATARETGDTVSALLSLRRVDTARLTEKLSPAARLLGRAPVWGQMDRESRGMYLTGVSRLSRALRVPERDVCRAALSLCEGREGAMADPGQYLLCDSRELRLRLGRRPGLTPRGKVGLYAALLCLGAALSLGGALLLLPWYGAVPLAFSGVGLWHSLLARACPRLLPRRLLPRLRADRLPAGTRALIAVPAVLTDRREALRMCRRLAVLYLANPDAPADFLLLADFAEAGAPGLPGDEEIIRAAAAGVEALRQAHGPRFFYLQRGRTADGCGRFSGRERKRGALAALSDLLLDGKTDDPLLYASALPASFARRYSHVITLDSDTFLPAGAPERLLGAITHPLQKSRIAVIQPRMLTLPLHVRTRAQRLLGGHSGADGYGAAAADLYQDAFGRGSFMGKGIYEPAAFRASTGGLPAGRVLSHDLLEGELAGSALASDIVCYDGHPRSVRGFLRREHRWVRGDWQIAGFLADERLDMLSKIKIWDNLRRSLTPFMRLAALAVCTYLRAWIPFLIALLPPAACGLLLLPAEALNALDAVFRALWRLRVSHRRLLEWTTAAQGDRNDFDLLAGLLPPMLWGAGQLLTAARSAFWPGFVLGACWIMYPLIARWLDGPIKRRRPLDGTERRFLADTARDTFAWFEERVNESTRFLPPDNEQEAPPRGVDRRTSPTNIGLYLLSLCAARELGFIDGPGLICRLERTLDTLERLPAQHGIPFNWYDLDTLSPMPPRVLSSVDAGNYLICLLAAAQAARSARIKSDVPARLDALAERMELQRLYDRQARLFYVSVEADSGKPSAGHYDLLASEAQLLSFAAIVCGRVPEGHWWRLGRPWAGGRKPYLLSWSGTMFEYMMGALLLPSWPGTLLDAARRGCVSAQRRAGREGFFGISESGCADFHADLGYRYRAFGVRGLALDPACAGAVYAPYAAALALPVAPEAACKALERMKKAGAYGRRGFYEAIDERGGRRIVASHMAHHQGMLLCAVCNALHEDALPGLLMQLPRVQAHLPLLCELPPRRAARLPRPLRAHRDRLPEGAIRIRPEADDALLMSGGGTSLLLNARGSGRLFRGDVSLTRFDPDPDALSGPQLYLAAENAAPLRLTGGGYVWMEGAARCSLTDNDVRAEVTACVDPLSGAAVYRTRLRSLSHSERRLYLIFYIEPAMENQRDDRAHVAFSNLFLSVAREGDGGCLLRRRPRRGGEDRLMRVQAYGEKCDLLDDRALFIGRDGGMEAPRGLTGAWRLTGGSEPCAALRVPVTLSPGGERTVCFAVGERIPDEAGALNAETLAAARSRVNRQVAGVDARLLAFACRAAGRLLFRWDAGAPARLRDLWALGIGGDEPLIAAELREEADTAAARQIARCFAWLSENGARAALVFLLPGEAGYAQPLRAWCEGLALPRAFIVADPAGRETILAHCALYLDCGRPLAGQPEPRQRKKPPVAATPGGALPALPRLFAWNGFGGFTPDFGYAVCRTAPAPWCHILCGERFGTLVSEQGILYSYVENSRLRRLTAVCQDSVITAPSERYFIEENGKSWSLTRRPADGGDCRVVYEMGAAVYRRALPGLTAALTVFADDGLPCGGRLLSLRNTGGETRRLAAVADVDFALGEDGRGTRARAGKGVVTARGDLDGLAFFALADGRAEALGASGSLRYDLLLRPGQGITLCFWLGWSESEETLPALLAGLSAGRERDARAAWRQRLDGLRFYLPDPLLSGWLGGFLPYQVRAARLMARAGFWQAGGAWGFRDQLQDMLALLYTEPGRVRRHLLLCASRQYAAGDVQHWWHPGGAGVRTRISDDKLFLPWVTARYAHVTGDRQILEESVPFLDSPPLGEGEADRYENAGPGTESAPLLEHCLRAINSLRFGEHGIPLMEGGDWNDGMNGVGGESVWLGFFLILVLRDFAPLCPQSVQDDFDRRRIALHTALQNAWTGRWFLRAWYRDGRTLGAPDSDVPRIDLISQCFAAFAGMPRDQVIKALDAAWDALHREDAGITLLLSPPFTPGEGAGYIGAYNPGVRENGGQYTHALPWFMRALLMIGRYDRAWQLLYECLPWSHSDTPEKARRYRVEPYVLAGDIHADGRGGWTWYTGSAAWLYEVILRDFLGFDKKENAVRLNPKAPEDWDEVTVLYRFGGSRWQLTAARDQRYITVDGEKATGAYVPLRDDGRAHEIRFPMQ